nr:formin-like protein 15 [Tanacetum cinerariifolium]
SIENIRHVYANFKKKYSGLQLQSLFWGATSSTVEELFYAKMDNLKYINLEAYEYLENNRLDGCFLKHTCRGELLTAMGRVSNNQMYPIAWAIVKVETLKISPGSCHFSMMI